MEWLKMKVLSSSPSTAKRKKKKTEALEKQGKVTFKSIKTRS
jgi:hypothetical protein